jgi:hypothetical protein
VDAGASLERAADVAVNQRVSPLLWRALRACGALPEGDGLAWADRLKGDVSRCQAHALMVLPQLAPAALVPLVEAGLTPLVYKGAALAPRYPAPGTRPMDDVDLVLPLEEVPAGVAVLERAGWRTVPPRPGSHHHEVILVHDALPGLPLELHRALADWRERSNHLTTLALWQWGRPGELLGQPVLMLPPEEEIVTLAAHAAKPFHVFDRLIWAVDIAVVIGAGEAAGTPVEWDRVDELAHRARCRTALAVALNQAARVGAPSPARLRHCPAIDARGQALLPVLSAEWPLMDRGWSTRTRLRYALVDDWRQRLTLFAGQVIEGGPVAVPRNAVGIGARGVNRWLRLRREAARRRQPSPRR